MFRRLWYGIIIGLVLVLILGVFTTASAGSSETLYKFDDTFFAESGHDDFSIKLNVRTKCDLYFTVNNDAASFSTATFKAILCDANDNWLDDHFVFGIGQGKTCKGVFFKDVLPGTYTFVYYVQEETRYLSGDEYVYTDENATGKDKPTHVYGTIKATNQKPYLSKSSLTLGIGKKATLQAYAPKGVKITSWSTSDKKVAKVSQSGKVTGVGFGTAKITVKLSNGKKLVCKVTVKPKINKTKATLITGSTLTLKVTGAGSNPVKWKSSNKSIAKVKNGKVTVGNKAGKVTITATVGSYKLKCVISVKAE